MMHTTQTYQIGDNVELMRQMEPASIDTIVTSPPYWGLRDYGVDGQIGLEPTLEEYHARMLEVTAECMRVLKPTGVMFWNHGDSYFGDSPVRKSATDQFNPDEQHVLKRSAGGIRRSAKSQGGLRPKCMTMQNERLIIKMIDRQGWILRDRIIWAKKVWFAKTNKTIGNCMPGSQKDRCTFSYEPIYMLTKSPKYWTDTDAIRVPYTEPMNRWGGQKLKADGDSKYTGVVQGGYRERDMRPDPAGATSPNVWQINTKPYTSGLEDVDHFAAFPTALVERLLTAFCPAEICPVCGMARERIIKIEKLEDEDDSTRKKRPRIGGTMREVPEKGWKSLHHTVGWTSCNCGAGWVAGTALDPFAGSGTVGEVARDLGRNAILLELNPDYERLISDRTMAHTPPLTAYFGDD